MVILQLILIGITKMQNIFKYVIASKENIEFRNMKFKDIVNFNMDGQIYGNWKTIFYNCDFSNIKILNSEIRDCEFYDCNFRNSVIINEISDSGIAFSNFFNCDFTKSYINKGNFCKVGSSSLYMFENCKFDLDNKIFTEKNNWRESVYKDFVEKFIIFYKRK